MRLLVVLHTPRSLQSAVYLSYAQLAAFAAGHGHTVTIRTPEDFPAVARVHPRWLPVIYPWAVWRRLRWEGRAYDLVVFHSYAGWVASLWRNRPFRMVTAFHGLEPLYYRELAMEMRRVGRPLRWPFRLLHGRVVPALLKASCRRSDAVFCLNRAEAAYLTAHRWAAASRIVIRAHGVSADFFVARQPRTEARTLLFVGQWLPRKGTRDLAEAFGALAGRRPDLRLCCVGTLVEEARVKGDFPDWLRPRIEVVSRVPNGQLVELYRAADVFVFPTVFEGFSRALLEAMAAGLPIVTTPAGAATDILTSGVDALLVPKRDPAALEEAISRLVEDNALRARLGQAAQRRAREFELPRVMADVEHCLEEIAARA